MLLAVLPFQIWALVAILVIAYAAYRWVVSMASDVRPKLPLPPGPKPVPLLGNISDMPKLGVIEYTHWLSHKDKYGPISSVTIMGHTLVIIHDPEVALDLLERKGAASKTSGRPIMPFAQDLVGYENSVVFGRYNATFRQKRALLHGAIGTAASAVHYYKAQEVEAMAEFTEVGKPFSLAVDFMPFLKHIPNWFPGASFKKKAKAYRETLNSMAHLPCRFVQHQLAYGIDSNCMMSHLIQRSEVKGTDGKIAPEDENLIVWAAASLFGAAVDTTSISLAAFTLAMLKYPDVQRKAQAEIDRVIRRGRFPTSADRERLPYVDAIVKETLRWWSIFPMGMPHRADEEIEYRGLRIPDGATIMPAVWWFMHDPAVYPDPARFDPERFADPARDEPDPTKGGVYGYGRRICPGRHFANNLLFLNMAQILAAFNITRLAAGKGRKSDGVDGFHPTPGPIM
ncbi:hypothetical protein RB601_003657 [Gaeumannomyces tritici]